MGGDSREGFFVGLLLNAGAAGVEAERTATLLIAVANGLRLGLAAPEASDRMTQALSEMARHLDHWMDDVPLGADPQSKGKT